MRLKRLNTKGIERFSAFLDSLINAEAWDYPSQLLTDPGATEEIDPPIEVEQRSFINHYALGEYLFDRFEDSTLTDIELDRGLWAWLALFYFEQLYVPDRHGNLKLGERAHWIPVFTARRYYRHFIAGPYRIFKLHRDDPQRAMIFLHASLGKLSHSYYQLASRQQLVTNKSVVELATEMYMDPQGQKLKRGAQTHGKPGTIFRLVDVLNQLDTTWDLYSLSKDQIAAMLPQEFDRFLRVEVYGVTSPVLTGKGG